MLTMVACAQPGPAALPTSAPPTMPPTAAPATKTPVPSLTLEALKNAEYPSEFPASKKARLTDGRYEEAIQPGAASKLVIVLHSLYALGDLNGDGTDDAAAILVANAGGSGSFYHLVAVLNEGGTPRPAAVASLGDRVKVEKVSVKSGEVTIDLITQGPQDPLCCPTQKATLIFKLQGDKLVRTGG